MAVFGFGEDKKLFGGNSNNSTAGTQAQSLMDQVEAQAAAPAVEEAPVAPAPAPVEDNKDAKIAEFTSKISDVEGVIKDIFYELGEKYFDLHSDDAESDLVNLVNDIKGRKELISDYRNKINDLKGIVICDKCGAETKNTSTFCMECGNKIKKTTASVPSGQQACSNCNSFIDAGAKFCTVCGYKVSEVAATIEAMEKEEPVVEAAPVKEESVFEPLVKNDFVDIPVEQAPAKECPSCGQALEPFDVMCFACGRKLVN